MRAHQESLLVSSPDAVVPYHADLPAQTLIQLAGHKRVHVYPGTRYRVELFDDWAQAIARWTGTRTTTPFQDCRWLGAWYRAFTEVEPIVAVITDAMTLEQVALLPLVRRRRRGVRIIEFADLDLTDYNAPLLGPAAPRDAAGAQTMWRELLVELTRMQGGADLIRLRKLPRDLDGQANPLTLLEGTGPSAVNGNLATIGEDFDAWRHSLGRNARKAFLRSWRVFTRDPQAQFRIITDPGEAARVMAAMEVQQDARMRALGLSYSLNDQAYAAFYRDLVAANLRNRYAVLTALTVGDEVVATLLGIRNGARYAMVRFSNAGEKWAGCSPGLLVIERTMAALHADGVRSFDFGTGNYAYKRKFGVTQMPLLNLTRALSLRGKPFALRDRIVRELRRYPRLAARISRALGTQSMREEF
jgi:CelD/BcsL family acetyltransferase involved in cellulose biosynthesis